MDDVTRLIGKTIISAKKCGYDKNEYNEGFDDVPFLELIFSDGSEASIEADYGEYTGNSLDEYPCQISIVFK